MKKTLLLNLALLLLSAAPVLAQKKVFVSDNVLKVAGQAQFDYKGTLKKATAKDGKALTDLFEFIRLLENAEADEHALTCLELIPVATDAVFANAMKARKPNLKAALLRRILDAQERTKKADLKKPLEEWAPFSFRALHNLDFDTDAASKPAAEMKPDPNAMPTLESAAGSQLKSGTDAPPSAPGGLVPAQSPTDAGKLAPPAKGKGN
ncbi:MAG: hypothetical protein ABMA02_19720 [Saprospiraceae bacterium]